MGNYTEKGISIIIHLTLAGIFGYALVRISEILKDLNKYSVVLKFYL